MIDQMMENQTLAEERIKLMFDFMPMSCIYLDENADIIDCNPEAIRLFGVKDKQEYKERFREFIPEYQPCGRKSADIISEIFPKTHENGTYSLEWMHVLPSGPLPFAITLVSAVHHGEKIIISYGRDLREEKKMLNIIEAERAKSEALAKEQIAVESARKWLDALSTILNALDSLIYVTDRDTYEILFMNDSLKHHAGFEGEEAGRLCYEILYQNSEPCVFCKLNQLEKEENQVFVWEECHYKTKREYRNSDRNIVWPDGRRVHLQHSVDITDLRMAERRAEQNSQAKSIFLTSMSHEIRTPMNAILGITEIRMQDQTLPSEIEEAFGIIYDSGSLLMNIINDVLDLSKIEAGKLEIVPAKYDVPSLINDTVQLNRLRYESKPLDFILEIDENTPLNILGDELRIKQILNNMLTNAFKYTEVGEVKLSVSAEVGTDMEMTLVLKVSDTGQGMTEDQIARLFDEYSRFNLEANRNVIGTGLGMSITKNLVEMMNGELRIESEPGVGSVFTIRLPQKRIDMTLCGEEVADRMRNFRYQRSAKKSQIKREYMPYGRVLVVDDVESNLYVAKGMLLPYGLTIETAKSGFEAIEYIRSGKTYDIIFMDHMMPQMDGIEARNILHESGYSHPIVALTANAVAGQAEMFLKSGFDGYISKPIDSRDLNQILNKMIRDKQSPEVIKKARHEAKNKDIEALAPILEEIIANLKEDSNLDLYITTVHNMKIALANMGEYQFSEAAFKLEQAGLEGDIDFIMSEMPAFLKVLRLI